MQVTIIGVGGLGGALARGLIGEDGVSLILCDKHEEKLARIPGARCTSDLREAVEGSDVIVLCVKPKAMHSALREISVSTRPGTLVISCAAGVSLSDLPGANGRAMPNIGAAVGASTTALYVPERALKERAARVFGAVGTVRFVDDEDMLHVVTAVAGSGPAFLLLAVEALVEGAVEAGMSRADARFFANGAARAVGAVLDGEEEAGETRAQVTSPGGTTIAGLAALEARAVRSAYMEAVRAAVRRAHELSVKR